MPFVLVFPFSMISRPAYRVYVMCFLSLLLVPSAGAQTKRALLIGINTYQPAGKSIAKPHDAGQRTGTPGSSRWDLPVWENLDGSLDDVQAMHDLLASSKFGFQEQNIHVLSEGQATREAILGAMSRYLLQEPSRGDIVVFYYAGHGSQRFNSLTDKPFHLDETLVPADASSGHWDVRDKEIVRLFNQIVDKGITLTAIFDSCHSGSIARGLVSGMQGRARFLPYDPRDAADPPDKGPDGKPGTKPEERPGGALVFSATQHDQSALEWTGKDGKPHGAFTVALLDALQTLPANSPAQDVYKRVKVLLLGMGVPQQPDLDAPPDRRQESLFGTFSGSDRLTVAVRPEGAMPDGTFELDGGLALGLGVDSELRKVGVPSGLPEIRVRIIQVEGLARSKAQVISPATSHDIRPGDLFELTDWVAPESSRLQVWMASSSLSKTDLVAVAEEVTKLKQAQNVIWIDDPVRSSPDYIMAWNGSEWTLSKANAAAVSFGRTFTANEIAGRFSTSEKARFFLALPPPSELSRNLQFGSGTANSAVELTSKPENAQYFLIGRWAADTGLEYAWLQKNTSDDISKRKLSADDNGNVCSSDSPYPPRTNWIALGRTSESLQQASQTLTDFADRLARIRSWLELPVPPGGASTGFPYHLALKKMESKRASRSGGDALVEDGTVVEGETFGLVLKAGKKLDATTPRRWVYVMAIQCNGEGLLLYPRSGEGNYLPERRPDGSSPPSQIDLTSEEETITIGSPFGIDTYILLTTDDQISDLSAFSFSGVLRGTRGGLSTPLTQLLGNASANTRGINPTVPVNWSVQFMPIRSVPAEKGATQPQP
ncbi:MAG: caspase family protein [Candidatus Acidiferrales bacterium]